MTGQRVAIVGAGLSGLLAGRTLTAAGRDVVLFDKARGPGGRLSTRRHDEYAFDHGAQYFTVRDERFRDEVVTWLAEGVAAPWKARLVDARNGTVHPHESPHLRYVGTPRMSAITRFLAQDQDARLATRIESLSRSEDGWQLRSASESWGPYDAVIVTTPPEQAVPLLADAPELAAAAAAVTSAPCWAVMAVFDDPLAAEFDGVFSDDPRLAWAARNTSKPERPPHEAWVLHGAGAWSRAHAEDPPESVTGELLGAFFEGTGVPPKTPAFVTAHRWMLSMAENPLADGALWDAERTVGVCGDWCCGCRVEGAALSGFAVADRILA